MDLLLQAYKLMQLEKYQEAETSCLQALEFHPSPPQNQHTPSKIIKLANLHLAQIFLKTYRLEQGISCCKIILELDPDFTEAYIALGIMLFKMNKLQYAIRCLQKAISLQPNKPLAYYYMGQVSISTNRINFGIQCKIKALSLDNTLVVPHMEYSNFGMLLVSVNQFQMAIQCYKRAVSLYPCFQYCLNLGKAFLQTEQQEAALFNFQRAIQLNPSKANAYILKGVILYQQKQTDNAARYFKKAFLLNSKYPGISSKLGSVFIRSQQFHNAIKFFKAEIRVQPQNEENYIRLGIAYSSLKQYRRAVDYYSKAIQLNPQEQQGYYGLMMTFCRLKQLGQAQKCYRRLLQLNPNTSQHYLYMGQFLRETNRIQQAIDDFNKALKLSSPNQKVLYSKLGFCYNKKSQYKQSIHSYQLALKWDDANPKLLHALGVSLFQNQQFKGAITCLQKAIQLEYTNQRLYLTLGYVFGQTLQFEEAIRLYKRSILLFPTNKQLFRNIGSIFQAIKQWQQAIRCYKRVLVLDSKDTNAFIRLANIFLEKSKVQHSQKCLYKALELEPNNPIIYFILGVCSERKRMFEKALNCFSKSLLITSNVLSSCSATLKMAVRNIFIANQLINFEETLNKFLVNQSLYLLQKSDYMSKHKIFFLISNLISMINKDPICSQIHNFWTIVRTNIRCLIFLRCYLDGVSCQLINFLRRQLIKKAEKLQNSQPFHFRQLMFFSILFSREAKRKKSLVFLKNSTLALVQNSQGSELALKQFLEECINLYDNNKNFNFSMLISSVVLFYLTGDQKRLKITIQNILKLFSRALSFVRQDVFIFLYDAGKLKAYIFCKYLLNNLRDHFLQHRHKSKLCVIQALLYKIQQLKYQGFSSPVQVDKFKKVFNLILFFVKKHYGEKLASLKVTKRQKASSKTKIKFKKEKAKYRKKNHLAKSVLKIDVQQVLLNCQVIHLKVGLKRLQTNEEPVDGQKYIACLSKADKKRFSNFIWRSRVVSCLQKSKVRTMVDGNKEEGIKQFQRLTILNQVKGKAVELSQFLNSSQVVKRQTYTKKRDRKNKIVLPQIEFPTKENFDTLESQQLSESQAVKYQQYYQLLSDVFQTLEHPFEKQFMAVAKLMLDTQSRATKQFQKESITIETTLDENKQQIRKAKKIQFPPQISSGITNLVIDEGQISSKYSYIASQRNQENSNTISSEGNNIPSTNSIKSINSSSSAFKQFTKSRNNIPFSLINKNHFQKSDSHSQFQPIRKHFDRLFFNHYVGIIQSLSSHRTHFKYVTPHFFEESEAVRSPHHPGYAKFKLKMTRGQEFNLSIRNITEEDTVSTLTELHQFIQSVVLAILELQDFGVCHQDIRTRNFVRFISEKEESIYKIIDFDWAFQLPHKEDKHPESSLETIVREWLRIQKEHSFWQFIGSHLFRGMEGWRSRVLQKKDIVGDPVEVVLAQLQNYMYISHKQQLLSILTVMFKNQQNYLLLPETIKKLKLEHILHLVKTIPETKQLNRAGYQRFLRDCREQFERIGSSGLE